jgi:predicted DNA-binding transcriptional regulator AlpA
MELEKLLTVQDVSQILGITVPGVYGLVFKKKLPAVKISKRLLRFSPKAIAIFIASKSQEVQEGTEPKPAIRRVKPKKGHVSGAYVDSLVERARKEVFK